MPLSQPSLYNPPMRPFLSYAREDADTAIQLRNALKARHVNVWMDRYELKGGENWKKAIKQALKGCSHFLALISHHSVSKRGYVQKELRTAIELLSELPPDSIYLVPIRLDTSVPVHEELRELHWIDLFPDFDEGVDRLLISLGVAE